MGYKTMKSEMDERNEKRIEELLRSERQSLLPDDFTSKLMAEVNKLPAPALAKPATSWGDLLYSLRLLGTGEKVAAALVLLGVAAIFLPGFSEVLAVWDWELSDMTVSMTIGETAASASLMSVLTISAGAVFMVGAGAYSMRSGMVGV